MVSIPSLEPTQQEERQTFQESRLRRQEHMTTYRYVSRLTPERVKSLTPEQKEQALLEFLTLFNLILSVLYNPIAKEATRLLALDVIVTQVQRTARKLIGTVTDKSPTFAAETEKRLGLSKNTISSGYKRLEKAGVLVRSHRTDEATRQEHLDIQPTRELFTRPEIIKDKKKRAAPKPHLGKSLDITKQCLECNSHNIRVTCRDCGSFIDVGDGEPRIMEATSNVVDADLSADRQESTLEDTTHHKICDDIQNPITVTNFVIASENEAKEHPITPPLNAQEILTTWLAKRIGEGQIIYSTGKTEQHAKYITLPVGTQPNISAYLQGDPHHIYGSRLATNNTTSVLGFDLDDPQLNRKKETYLSTLTQAGAKPLYWHRRNGRGHLELYFSEPVNTEAAYQWCVSVCPALASIPECYPARDKKANGLSWPLYQRVGTQVYECPVSCWTDGGLRTLPGIQTDLQGTLELIQRAVTPCELIPESRQTRPESPTDQPSGGVLLEKDQESLIAEKRCSPAQDADLAKAVITDFNNSHTWEEVAACCGGIVNHRFCAVWRGEDTPSVIIDKNGLYACDYGRIGDYYPKKLDKYEIWVLSHGGVQFKKRDLAERIAAYRRQEPRQTRPKPQTKLSEAEQNSRQQHALQAMITVQVMAKPVTQCCAVFALNKEGRRAGAREEIVSYQECGATRWLWSESDQCYICAECLTPFSTEGE